MLKRIIWCVMIIGVMFAVTNECDASNILRNADFSEINENGIVGWVGDEDTKDRYKLYLVDGALCIENKISNYTRLSQNVRVEPESYYKFSAKIKVLRESNTGGYIKVDLLNDAVTSETKDVMKRSDEWEEVTLYGKTDKGQYFVGVSLCLGNSKSKVVGKVLMKDVKLEKIDYIPKDYDNWYIDTINTNRMGILQDFVTRIAIGSFFIFVVWCIVKNVHVGVSETTSGGIGKKDVVIMCILTLVYVGMALYKLGNIKACETGWLTNKEGEYVVMQLPKMMHIGRINIFEGQNDIEANKGKLKLEYLDEDLLEDDDERYHIIERRSFSNHQLRTIVEDTRARTIKISVIEPGIDLKEIAIYERGSKEPVKGIRILEDKTNEHVAKNLLDEQTMMSYNGSHMMDAVFDEVLYARTGYEYLNNQKGFEDTHPPLGKIIMAIGIKLFGMTPFGWRIMSTLFGVMMVPAMYMFGRKFFSERLYIVGCTMLMMFDCMHFTQTRTSLIDSYSVFFIIMMYYYMMDVYSSSEMDRKYKRSLFLSGLFFSLGVATKWIVVYGGVGLAVLYFISLYRNFRYNRRDVVRALCMGVLFFVGMPIVAYMLVYIPVLKPTGYSVAGVVQQIRDMWVFHRDEWMARYDSSRWYEWIFNMKPLSFYGRSVEYGKVEGITTVGNPTIWLVSLVSVVASAIIGYKKKDNRVWVFVVGYLCQYMPWMFITRTTYIYHYFSAVSFAMFAIMYVFRWLSEYKTRDVVEYLVIVVLSFLLYYPMISGMIINERIYEAVFDILMKYVVALYYIVYYCKMTSSKIK